MYITIELYYSYENEAKCNFDVGNGVYDRTYGRYGIQSKKTLKIVTAKSLEKTLNRLQ